MMHKRQNNLSQSLQVVVRAENAFHSSFEPMNSTLKVMIVHCIELLREIFRFLRLEPGGDQFHCLLIAVNKVDFVVFWVILIVFDAKWLAKRANVMCTGREYLTRTLSPCWSHSR